MKMKKVLLVIGFITCAFASNASAQFPNRFGACGEKYQQCRENADKLQDLCIQDSLDQYYSALDRCCADAGGTINEDGICVDTKLEEKDMEKFFACHDNADAEHASRLKQCEEDYYEDLKECRAELRKCLRDLRKNPRQTKREEVAANKHSISKDIASIGREASK